MEAETTTGDPLNLRPLSLPREESRKKVPGPSSCSAPWTLGLRRRNLPLHALQSLLVLVVQHAHSYSAAWPTAHWL